MNDFVTEVNKELGVVSDGVSATEWNKAIAKVYSREIGEYEDQARQVKEAWPGVRARVMELEEFVEQVAAFSTDPHLVKDAKSLLFRIRGASE